MTGVIADQNLGGVAWTEITLLLGPEDLAEASPWPDVMKSDHATFWQK